MKAFFLIAAAAPLVAACSLGELTGGPETPEAADTAEAEPEPTSLRFTMASESGAAPYAERLAAYALACWVRDDPNYKVGGPLRSDNSHNVILLSSDPEAPDAQPLRALLLRVEPGAATGQLAVIAAGPLATRAYAPQIETGLRKVAGGATDCD